MMKLNLGCNGNFRNGYVNVLFAPINIPSDLPKETQVVMGQISNLRDIAGEESVEEILFSPPINTIDPVHMVQIVDHWKDVVMDGGRIKFSYFDIRKIGYYAYAGRMSLEDIHGAVYGGNYELKSVMDQESLRAMLESLGLKLVSMVPNGFMSNVEVVKDVS